MTDVRDVTETAVGGRTVSEIIEEQKRFDVAVRLPASMRRSRETLGAVQMRAPVGELVSLGQVANIRQASGPEIINREDSQRRIVVQVITSNGAGNSLSALSHCSVWLCSTAWFWSLTSTGCGRRGSR